MKANNTTIENALYLAFSPEYVNALSLVELAETWSDNHNARDLELNIAAYAEQCTYKMEQEGATLEFDAWERLTAEIERGARVWVSLYCNEISWSNRPEWIANSVRAALNTTTTPETPNPTNTPSTMNANKTTSICPLDFPTALDAYNYALAHQHDASPLAVAIESNNYNAPLLRSLVLNGVNVFGVWCDAMDDTATSLLYTTEAGAREAMAQVEANDKESGVYDPDYYKVLDMSKYFL